MDGGLIYSSSSEDEDFDPNRKQAEIIDEINFDTDEDIFKILISTDNHLGYYENNAVRGNDSFNTFEEILQIAVKEDVDFILLGGDMFHINKPTANSYTKCIDLLVKYVQGNKQMKFSLISDQEESFQNLEEPKVNYENPFLNISYPIFTIHGNHDDPVGLDAISAMDLLAEAGLVNYFGSWHRLDCIVIKPLIFQKGNTKLAIYGISHIHDRRFSRLLKEAKVQFVKPNNPDDYFHIFVLHQNRAARGPLNYFPTDAIPKFMDLVVWGHEHDCFIDPINMGFLYITQPGSSVATSLTAGEAKKKHVGILHVRSNKGFRLDPIALKTVRPMIFEEINIDDVDEKRLDEKEQSEYTESVVEQRLDELLETFKNDNPTCTMLPLVRLVVYYLHKSQYFNRGKLIKKYAEVVANPEDVILLKAAKKAAEKRKIIVTEDLKIRGRFSVLDCIAQEVENSEEMRSLSILSGKNLNSALARFVQLGDSTVFDDYCDLEAKEAFEFFKDEPYLSTDREVLDEEISKFNETVGAAKKQALFQTMINDETRCLTDLTANEEESVEEVTTDLETQQEDEVEVEAGLEDPQAAEQEQPQVEQEEPQAEAEAVRKKMPNRKLLNASENQK